ncbi:sugar transferase, partial [Campylobacter vulpis]
IFCLFKVTKQHHKHLKTYQQITEVFPQLHYPPLKQCEDYQQGLECKFHLSYLLGSALIKASKAWYKGGYLKLFKDIKGAKKLYKALKEIKESLGVMPNLEGITTAHLQSLQAFKTLLKTSYEPLKSLLLQNFIFALTHFDEISLWLNSKEFKEKYEKENHPYPPLLNPDILNELLAIECDDKQNLKSVLKEQAFKLSKEALAYINANLDYRLIPAEKAWEMNLPLPRRYEFIGFLLHTNGEKAFSKFLTELQIELIFSFGYDAKLRYEHYFKNLSNNQSKKALIFLDQHIDLNEKFCLLMQDAPLLVLVRDPLDALRSFLNVRASLNGEKIWTLRYDDLLKIDNKIVYVHDERACYNPNSSQKYPLIDSIKSFIDKTHWMLDFSLNRNRILKYYENNMYFIDMYEIVGQNCYETLKKIAQDFHLKIPEKSLIFEQRLYSILT